MVKIGWIGLGQMGTPMVENLLKASVDVTVYNRSFDKTLPLVEKGAKNTKNVEEIFEQNEIIFFMISNYSAALEILNENVLSKIKGKKIVNMSTISPTESKAVGKLVIENNGKYIEAPVSGSVGAATAGVLLILAGGNEADTKDLYSIFDILGSKTYYFGELGKATGAKLVLNSLLGIFGEAYSEVLLLAQNFGIDTETIVNAISDSRMSSPLFQEKKDMFTNREYPAAFMLKHMTKDLKLSNEEIENRKLSLPLIQNTTKNYSEALEQGYGEQDMAAIFEILNKKND
ncbi:NAD(P)-dependent oxidoreductase [Leptotrichia trevisanii]|uniref:NAD(P)-dependent oxidoreductase n=1 Tax=Leptotrichia trevisanii TaxID=109328 RepID=UPI0026F346E8|nr:NAD(P)-dependent oxidoreductase [Leptotrichia trevisanii]